MLTNLSHHKQPNKQDCHYIDEPSHYISSTPRLEPILTKLSGKNKRFKNIVNIVKYSYSYFVLDIDECEPAPCQNGGTCVDAVNGFSCTCDEGFAGNQCSVGKILAYYRHYYHTVFVIW